MAPTVGFSSTVSVETFQTSPFWTLAVPTKISDPFPETQFDLTSLYEPFVILTDCQDLSVKRSLQRSEGCKWYDIWTTLVDSDRYLPKFLVTFYSRFGSYLDHEFDVDKWEVSLGFTRQSVVRRPFLSITTDSLQRQFQAVSSNVFNPLDGERRHEIQVTTPIEDVQAETIHQKGSSMPTQDVRHWFDERHYSEGVSCWQATNTSISPITNTQLVLTPNDWPEERPSAKYNTISGSAILSTKLRITSAGRQSDEPSAQQHLSTARRTLFLVRTIEKFERHFQYPL